MTEALALGGASWNTMIYLDRFPDPVPATIQNARSNIAAGSTGIGKALALRALGHETLLHATIGDDEPGRMIRKFLEGRGIRTRYDIDPGGTSRHVNLMDTTGQRISIFLFNGSPEPPVSNGAGDVFFVALWHALKGGALPDALRFAATAAAITVESLELVPPDLDEAICRRLLIRTDG